MKGNPLARLVEEYRDSRRHFEAATKELRTLTETILVDSNIDYFAIESRTKSVESLDGKIRKKGVGKYNVLSSITDLSGVCVVVYFEDQVQTVTSALEGRLIGLNQVDRVDKMAIESVDTFGYRAYHLTVDLRKNLADLSDEESQAVDGCRGEIQIKTAFMHAWSRIEHRYNYKANAAGTLVKRRFARLASLVEVADTELSAIHSWFEKHGDKAIDDRSVHDTISDESNQDILSILAEKHSSERLSVTDEEIECCRILLHFAEFESITEVREQLEIKRDLIVSSIERTLGPKSEIPSVYPMKFLAYDRILSNGGTGALVGALGETHSVESEIDLLRYTRHIQAALRPNE